MPTAPNTNGPVSAGTPERRGRRGRPQPVRFGPATAPIVVAQTTRDSARARFAGPGQVGGGVAGLVVGGRRRAEQRGADQQQRERARPPRPRRRARPRRRRAGSRATARPGARAGPSRARAGTTRPRRRAPAWSARGRRASRCRRRPRPAARRPRCRCSCRARRGPARATSVRTVRRCTSATRWSGQRTPPYRPRASRRGTAAHPAGDPPAGRRLIAPTAGGRAAPRPRARPAWAARRPRAPR